MNKLWYLSRCNIFCGLDKKVMDKIASIASDKTVPKKHIIYSPGDKAKAMFILKRGRVRIFKISPTGKMITLSILQDGDIFGAMSIIKGGVLGAYAETMEESYICQITQGNFYGVIKETPELALRVAERINQRLKEAEGSIEDLALRSVPGRIASILLKLAEKFGKNQKHCTEIALKITHRELADMAGASRETVTLVLNKLKKDKIIKMEGRRINIADKKRLKQSAEK